LRGFPQAGRALELLSFSPRPFSAGSVVKTPNGKVFVKRHHFSVRDAEGLREEHGFIEYLAGRTDLVQPALAREDGETVATEGDWSYEVHPLARGVDAYEEALSWTPFMSVEHARAAGRAMAQLHRAAEGYEAPARKARQLVTSFTLFAGGDPIAAAEDYLKPRAELRGYLEQSMWRESFQEIILPLYAKLAPWVGCLEPLWTHNDLHASNMTWATDGDSGEVTGVFDFGLADRTNAVHDIATAIERNIVEWLRIGEPGIVHFDQLDALLRGYEELLPLGYEQAQALVALLPLVHCEFALSEADYFLSILRSEEKADLAWDGYFLGHERWFGGAEGRELISYLERWAAGKLPVEGKR